MRNLVLLFIMMLLLTGCTISQKKQFEKVEVGMEKDQVLGLLDSPQRTQRWHGLDRWTYIFYDENHRLEKEVHFNEGKASYVGDTYAPPISANDQDKTNETTNQELETLAQTHKEDFRKAYRGYEDQVHGRDTIRYVPQYEPVQ